MKSKLEAGKYDYAESVARDIRLIWDNCILYNSEESEFGVLAASLRKKFEEKYTKVKSFAPRCPLCTSRIDANASPIANYNRSERQPWDERIAPHVFLFWAITQ